MVEHENVERLEFSTEREEWNQYKLEDGTLIEVKIVAVAILKNLDVIDEFGVHDYIVKSQNIVRAIPPHWTLL